MAPSDCDSVLKNVLPHTRTRVRPRSGGIALIRGITLALAAVCSFSCLLPTSIAFNLDTTSPLVVREPGYSPPSNWERTPYFGYSVALYRSGDQAGVFVGAPRGNSSVPSSPVFGLTEPGRVFLCPLRPSQAPCTPIEVDSTGNDNGGFPGNQWRDRKDFQWLGGSLDVVGIGPEAPILTCAPRWVNSLRAEKDGYSMNGACYWAFVGDVLSSTSSVDWTKTIPLVDYRKQRTQDEVTHQIVYDYQYGQVGISASITQDGKGYVLGAPGIWQWTGSVVNTESSSTPVEARRRRRRSWSSMDIAFTQEEVAHHYYLSKDYDLFGYSVATGYFWGHDDLWTVAGAPRAADTLGKVYIFKQNFRNGIEVYWSAEGGQTSAGFGSVVLVVDLNDDGYDDLVVSSPLYTSVVPVVDVPKGGASSGQDSGGPEEGRVTVFLNDATGGFRRQELRSPSGEPWARFGASLAALGDLDRDGYPDMAVGSPYEDGGRGAIYIFRGASQGLSSSPPQRVSPRGITHPWGTSLLGFGASLSRGLDIDGNGYPDVAIGSWESETAVVFLARPVIRVRPELSLAPGSVVKPGAPFDLRVCFTLTGHYIEPSYRVTTRLELDYGSSSQPRAFFLDPEGTSSTNTSFTTSSRPDFLNCRIVEAHVKDTSDVVRSLIVFMEVSSPQFSKERPFCERCGVLDPAYPTTTRLALPLTYGCGSDGTCVPEWSLKTYIVAFSEDSPFILGSGTEIILEAEVSNEGETAYLSVLKVDLPPSVVPLNLPFACSYAVSSAPKAQSLKEEGVVTCSLKSPLEAGERDHVTIVLQEAGVASGTESLSFVMGVGVKGGEEELATLTLPLRTLVDVTVYPSGEESATYDLSEASEVNMTAAFQVVNVGTSPLGRAVLEVQVPVLLGQKRFARIESFRATTGGMDNWCSLGAKNETLLQGTSRMRFQRLEEDGSLPSVPVQEDQFSRVYEDVKELKCGNEDDSEVECDVITCQVGPVGTKAAEASLLTVLLKVNVSVLQESTDVFNQSYVIHFRGAVTSLPDLPANVHQPEGHKPDSGVVSSLLMPRGSTLPPLVAPAAPWWVYLLAVLGGVLLLVAIAGALYKIGFFTRKTPPEELAEGGAAGGTEESGEEEEDAEEEKEEEEEEEEEEAGNPKGSV
ncbi:integrin alpha-5-like isoform X2 [Oratosquilla oratoria]|uniref:integrin alpha-5-like isoform X2 n=1 Tax=Oratosquilla oratoria TaxID=337810 RepID=UPI003F77303D